MPSIYVLIHHNLPSVVCGEDMLYYMDKGNPTPCSLGKPDCVGRWL